MAYLRFQWFVARNADAVVTVHRFAVNASSGGTVQDYHRNNGMTMVAGPFKTKKEALAKAS